MEVSGCDLTVITNSSKQKMLAVLKTVGVPFFFFFCLLFGWKFFV